MKTIAYTGSSDFQEFSKDDLAKGGVEDGKDLRFAQGEPTEVEDEVAEALLSKEGVFGDHSFTDLSEVGTDADTEEEQTEEQRAVAEKKAKAAAKKTAKKAASGSGATTEGTANPAAGTGGPASTGAGSSTGGPTT